MILYNMVLYGNIKRYDMERNGMLHVEKYGIKWYDMKRHGMNEMVRYDMVR